MKVVATSDLHGFLPVIPECDLLLIAGDVCPYWDHRIPFQARWLNTAFRYWLDDQPAKHVVAVFGNHDLIGEESPHLVPGLNQHLLQDSMVEVDGLRIYGLPWQRRFNDWAFNLDDQELNEKYEAIPECDIIVSHGPPYGLGDRVGREHVGSRAFDAAINRCKPQLVVYGHIHECHGMNDLRYFDGKACTCVNVTHVDEKYNPVYPVWTFDL